MKNNKTIFVLAASMLLLSCGGTTSSSSQSSSADHSTSSASSNGSVNSVSSSSESSATSSQSSSETSSAESSSAIDLPATFSVTTADLTSENGHAFFSVSGLYNTALSVNAPKLIVRNGDDGDDPHEGDITVDSVTATYQVKVDLSTMKHDGTWYDVKLYLDSTAAPTGEIMKDTLPNGVFEKTVKIDDLTYEGVTREYGFQEWSNFLKITVSIKDTAVTSFAGMSYSVKEDGVYFNLKGVNEHEGAFLRLKKDDTTYVDTLAPVSQEEGHPLDVSVKVSDFLNSGDKYGIFFFYTVAGSETNVEMTNHSLADHVNLKGVAYNGNDYVFRADTWSDNIYYKVGISSDAFCMDTIRLSNVNDKITMRLKGTLNTTAAKDDLKIALVGTELTYPIDAAAVDANGYLDVTVDVTDVPLYSDVTATGDGDQMAITVTNGTTALNKIWAGDWSQHNDVLTATTATFAYTIAGVHWGEYALKKTALAA